MVDSGSFKHISVTAPEEEDVVITAGIGSLENDAETGAAQSERATSQEAQAKSGEKQGRKAGSKPRKQEYPEQTLEDLEPEPMPLTQKLFIIAAVICIIGAFVFYMAFIR